MIYNYYDNRFDFLRVSNSNAPKDLPSTTLDSFIEYFDNVLPVSKEVYIERFTESALPAIQDKPIGNVVNGSTCFFVDKGDFYIYFNGMWYNPETGDSYYEGVNPYYSGNEPIPPIG